MEWEYTLHPNTETSKALVDWEYRWHYSAYNSIWNKVIEFEKGKNAIELSSKAELEPTLQNIKKAVDNGEFDALLEEQLAYGSRLTKQ